MSRIFVLAASKTEADPLARLLGVPRWDLTTDNWVLPETLGVPVQFYPDLPPTGLAHPLAATTDLSVLRPLAEARSAGVTVG